MDLLHVTICSTGFQHAAFTACDDWNMQYGFLHMTIGICSMDLLHITIGGAEISAGGDWKMQHGFTAYNDWRCRNFCR